MKDVYVTTKQATSLSRLGFKERCLFHYNWGWEYKLEKSSRILLKNWNKIPYCVAAPLNQQAIQFLLKSIGGLVSIEYFSDGSGSWYFEDKKVSFKTIPQAINLGIEHLQSIPQNTFK